MIINIVKKFFNDSLLIQKSFDCFCSDDVFKNIINPGKSTLEDLSKLCVDNFNEDRSIFASRIFFQLNQFDHAVKHLEDIIEKTDSFFWALEAQRYLFKFEQNSSDAFKYNEKIDFLINDHKKNYDDYSDFNPYFSYWPLSITPAIAKRIINYSNSLKNNSSEINFDYRFFIPALNYIGHNENNFMIDTRCGFSTLFNKLLIYVPELFFDFQNLYKKFDTDISHSNDLVTLLKINKSSQPLFIHEKNFNTFSIYKLFDKYLVVSDSNLSLDPFENNPFDRINSFYTNCINDAEIIINLLNLNKNIDNNVNYGEKINDDHFIVTSNFLGEGIILSYENGFFIVNQKNKNIANQNNLIKDKSIYNLILKILRSV